MVFHGGRPGSHILSPSPLDRPRSSRITLACDLATYLVFFSCTAHRPVLLVLKENFLKRQLCRAEQDCHGQAPLHAVVSFF